LTILAEFVTISATMKQTGLLEKIFEILAISADGRVKIREEFDQILSARLWGTFIQEIPENKKQELASLLQTGPTEEEISQWLKSQNISLNSDFAKRISLIVKESFDELIRILIEDISEKERKELLALVKEENI
jgi:hypothetical protein